MQRTFIQQGYVILKQAVPVDAALKEMCQHFPKGAANPVQDFGSGGAAIFPSTPALNEISVHPTILKAVREIIGDDIRLRQSVPWAKYGVPSSGKSSNSDQRIHMDYGNNQWSMPEAGRPQAVAAIVYYSETKTTGGATAIVPRRGQDDPVYQWPALANMPGIGGIPFVNDREHAEMNFEGRAADIRQQCYAREIMPVFEPGDVLLYGLDTWHRGTPVLPGHVRYTHNLMWSTPSSDVQQWNRGFLQKMYYGDFEKFISALEPHQLQTLGFPSPTNSRWLSKSFVTGIKARYEWAGFHCMEYVHSGRALPPPVPTLWHWAHLKLESTDNPSDFREQIFAKVRERGMTISMKHNWRYIFETVTPYYIEAECRFFTDGKQCVVDINQLSGDRFEWAAIASHIRGETYRGWRPSLYQVKPLRADKRLEALIHPWMNEELFDLIGPDVSPVKLLSLLNDAPPNIKRCTLRALYRCDIPFDISVVEPFTRGATTFLEKRIQHWANKIVQKGIGAAHL